MQTIGVCACVAARSRCACEQSGPDAVLKECPSPFQQELKAYMSVYFGLCSGGMLEHLRVT